MELKDELKENFKDRVFFEFPASEITSFKTGGKISILLFPLDKKDIETLYNLEKQHNVPVKFLGRGSNVLISDKGYNGILAMTENFSKLSLENENVYAESGVKISGFLSFCMDNNLKNMEFLTGIPGSIGGAIIMNAGTKDLFISSITDKINFLDKKGGWVEKNVSEIITGYRMSSLKEEAFFIVSAIFKLERGNSGEIKQKMKEIMKTRMNIQPLEHPSAGSIFKNPPGFFAGKLIEDAGLKGTKTGGVEISEKHANFIINTGNANSSDVYELIMNVKEKIFSKYGIILEPEIEFIGDF
ncbi:MAG: UDP-N-acetylmuramate dehydrogenase [Candidatus Omnitrophica bacterium]|nr:UDP-N-acetylmuramate dehydrogenase [Candidatus Omnitrophota bacterium]